MKKIFVKSSELSLVNGGYVVTGKAQTPVFNEDFVKAQKHAEWVMTFAAKAKGKDFIGKDPDKLEDLMEEVRQDLEKSGVTYVSKPEKVKMDLTSKLAKEAMDFVMFAENTTKVAKINKFMQSFNVIQEFEQFGLYFEEDICKLNKIYTIEEIVTAVKEVIDLI